MLGRIEMNKQIKLQAISKIQKVVISVLQNFFSQKKKLTHRIYYYYFYK